MSTAEIRISDRELLPQMTQMRVWLDSCRFEPARFRYFHAGTGVVVRVEFAHPIEAQAFAEEFAGRLLP